MHKENIIFSGDYTIYFDENGKKTMVKKMKGEVCDYEKAAAYCILKSMGVKPKHVNDLVVKGLQTKKFKEINKQKKNKNKNDNELTAYKYVQSIIEMLDKGE